MITHTLTDAGAHGGSSGGTLLAGICDGRESICMLISNPHLWWQHILLPFPLSRCATQSGSDLIRFNITRKKPKSTKAVAQRIETTKASVKIDLLEKF